MIANYHTHTALCLHATGSMRQYVEAAIKNGLTTLGFSDHSPCDLTPLGTSSDYRMKEHEVEQYVRTAVQLREEYRDRIKILIGYECEYYPSIFDDILRSIGRFECDYIILGEHHINNELDGCWSTAPTRNPAHLTKYVDLVIEAMQTGKFSYVAHPDVLNYVGGDDRFYQSEAARLCSAAKATDTPLEINCLGLKEGRHYPNDLFWPVAAEYGCDVIIGSDAHMPEDAGNRAVAAAAERYAARFGSTPIKTLKLKPIK